MSKNISKTCIILGLALGLIALWLAFANLNGTPVLLDAPEDATHQVASLMDAVCAADYPRAEALLYGEPELGLEAHTDNVMAQLVYPLYKKSISYTIRHDPYVTDEGLSVCVDVRSLNLSQLMEKMAQKLTELDLDAPSTQEGEPVVGLEHWSAALAAVNPEEYPYGVHTITLNLVHEQGQWWILPEKPLLNVICGITE